MSLEKVLTILQSWACKKFKEMSLGINIYFIITEMYIELKC